MQNVLSGSELVSVGEGKGLTVFVIPEEVATQLLFVVTTTSTNCPLVRVVVVYAAELPDCTEDPPTLKLYVAPAPPPPAVKVTLVPVQKILFASELVSVGTGKAFTVLVIPAEVDEQLLASVTITLTTCPFVKELVVYVDEAPFCTLIPPTLKLYKTPPEPVKVTEEPAQNELSASELESPAAGNAFMTTVTGVLVLLTQFDVVFLVAA
jgi:hypothetical protein